MEDDKIHLNQGRKKRDDLSIEGFQGNDFGDKVNFTVGLSYVLASCFGMIKGTITGFPKNWKLPKKLILNNFFNEFGKQQSAFGNAAASAGLMYYIVGSTIHLFFEDELQGLSNMSINAIVGSLTGAIYKSSLGIRPMLVGSILGGSLMGSLSLLTNHLYKQGNIAFEMKF